MKVTVKMNGAERIVNDKGLGRRGKAQMFHTANVMRRIVKYMPFRTGATIKTMMVQTDIRKPELVLDVPHGKYIFYGYAMVGDAPRIKTNIPLNYTKTKHPLAGPRWDRALSAAEGKVLARELTNYLRRMR